MPKPFSGPTRYALRTGSAHQRTSCHHGTRPEQNRNGTSTGPLGSAPSMYSAPITHPLAGHRPSSAARCGGSLLKEPATSPNSWTKSHPANKERNTSTNSSCLFAVLRDGAPQISIRCRFKFACKKTKLTHTGFFIQHGKLGHTR